MKEALTMADQDIRLVRISFRAESDRDAAAWGRTGMTAIEQVEADMEQEGAPITVAPASVGGTEDQRGFFDAVLISVVADAFTTLLFKAATDLILRWRRMRRAGAPGDPAAGGDGGEVILHAGDSQLTIPFDTPGEQIYQQLSLWSPHALAAGDVTFEVASDQV